MPAILRDARVMAADLWRYVRASRERTIAAAVIVAALVLSIIGVSLAVATRPIPVPKVTGMTRQVAQEALHAAGFEMVVKGTALSPDVRVGCVASQDPTAGVSLSHGSLVVVLLSAGPGTFPVPEILGMTLDVATQALKDKGLIVESDSAPSVAPSGTVIDSVPAAGELVSSGDTIHLTIATGGSTTVTSDMSGLSFVIDPEPPAFLSGADVTYDVAQRLAELLRMAGASVSITRGQLGSSNMPGVASRASTVRASDATAAIGLTVGTDQSGGLRMSAVPSSESSMAPGSSSVLADAVSVALSADFSSISSETVATDPVFSGADKAAFRLRLGSSSVASDKEAFQSADWAQKVAHDLYSGLAAMYGRAVE